MIKEQTTRNEAVLTRRDCFEKTCKLLFSFFVMLALCKDGYAQDKTGEIDKIFRWATQETPGCACAVAKDGKVVVNRAYGSADLERSVPLNVHSIFDAGSLTKQFVAAAILLLVKEERLSLSDDVRKYIPQLPDYGHTITIDHLLTHTSGIRDWTGMLPLAAGNEDALTMILRQRSLNFVPGEEWSYSNSGYVLLKEIVARASGLPFADFTRKRIFEPLGMKSTSYREDMREVIRNRALAYDKGRNGWRLAMLLDNDRGGGGILSTAADLLIWNEALAYKTLSAFVTEKIQEPARLKNGRLLSYARGLFIDKSPDGSRFWWHSGSADGYKSLLGRFPEHSLSIAIMCNSGDGTDRVSFARRIFDLLVPAAGAQRAITAPPIASSGVDTASLDLSSRTGLYFNENSGEPLQLVVDRGRLRVANGPILVAQAKDRFKPWETDLNFLSNDDFELHFLSPNGFERKTMEGKIVRYRRGRPFAPKPDELKAFAGRFGSVEIGTVFRMEPKGNQLVMSLEHAPARRLELKPVDEDTFQFNRMLVRFRRDKSGQVMGLDYSNPLLRNVQFTRLNDTANER